MISFMLSQQRATSSPMQDAVADMALLHDEDRFQILLLDSSFVLVVSMMLSKSGVGEDENSVHVVAVNIKYFILAHPTYSSGNGQPTVPIALTFFLAK
jgi:hypothetical protein